MRVRIVLVLLVALGWSVADAHAQGSPPNAWHPYRGGTNCVQIADAQGFFNCSPLVTINPLTGVFNSVLGGPITQVLGPLVIAPQTLQANLESVGNDLVIATSSLTSVAPTGPGQGAATLRIRPSPLIPGYCRLVVAGGNSFNQEFVVVVANLAFPRAATTGRGYAEYYMIDFPGGPGGC
jgi:hypothetical protein